MDSMNASSEMGMNLEMSDSPMSMQDMVMTFFMSTTTPLFSTDWTPSSSFQYAMTCIFVVVLAIILRCLLALRSETVLVRIQFSQGRQTRIGKQGADDSSLEPLTPSRDYALDAKSIFGQPETRSRGVVEVVFKAVIDTMIALVSYLLMIAVMTMNIGYLLSALAGTLVGSIIAGFAVMSLPRKREGPIDDREGILDCC